MQLDLSHPGVWSPGRENGRGAGRGGLGFTRLVVAIAKPGILPDKATWYLATNLPRPGSPREAGSPQLGGEP
jgi:hypothetical protein